MMLSKFLLDIAKPFMRYSPRFTGLVYKQLGGQGDDASWSRYGKREMRGAEHGYKMLLDLGDWSQRAVYYHGRYYDLAAQRLIRHVLGPGDTFVDVGANIGMLTLAAARVVGEKGTILAFEPNPEANRHLEKHLQMNGLSQVRVFDDALSCKQGQGTLAMPTESSGRSTLRDGEGHPVRSFEVQTALLDDFAEQIPSGKRTLIKIDTEGFEFNVLKGGRRLLKRDDVLVLVEVTDAWLRELGQSAEMLFEFMEQLGYQPYHPYMRPRGLRQHLVIEPALLPGPHHQFDALFIRNDNRQVLSCWRR